jgi:hypothetical protein
VGNVFVMREKFLKEYDDYKKEEDNKQELKRTCME